MSHLGLTSGRLSPPSSLWPLAAVLLVSVTGCDDQSPSPTAPEATPELSATAAAPLSFRQVSPGNLHTCGVTTGSLAYCWGGNSFGNLGDGTSVTRNAPVAVLGGLQFSEVRAGVTHTCGLTTEGRAYCWGENSVGQLGDGSAPTGHPRPVAVAGTRRFTQIRVGYRHTCALASSGVAFCWGENGGGQLGVGSLTGPQDCSGIPCSIRPVRVSGGLTFRQVRTGGEHTCGLAADRRAYCWGNNFFGQLGDGTVTRRLKPAPVAGARQFGVLSAGGMHSCAVTLDEVGYCWGRNVDGRVGDGSTTARRLRPSAISGGLRFIAVNAGVEHTCGLTTGRLAYCWGSNLYAQLGDGTRITRPTPVAVAGGLSWTLVLGGWRHSCGITSTARAYCWGENGFGQVGDGTSTPRLTPVAVASP
jgi:alpha-tubulin suppressor-like RCC1 family protein